MNLKNLWFINYMIEHIANHFYDGNQYDAYQKLNSNGFLDILVENYETLHTQSPNYILEIYKEKCI